jgi:predicted glycosyltransferase
MQVPRILRSVNKERRWLRELQSTENFDLVISDNRYGLKIRGTYSVIMTHQLQILTGSGALADRIVRKLHYRQLEKFDECWVVDHAGSTGLAGALSHPDHLPSNAHYIGPLSQLETKREHSTPSDGEILVLLSGPEPMRRIFEQKILHQAAALKQYQFTIIAGNPSGSSPTQLPEHVHYYTHANAGELGPLLAKAPIVICRSGYSTLMDLAVMGKKALLVPTPGQSEQEYLAKSLHARQIVPYQNEVQLDLEKGIAEASQWPGFSKATPDGDAMHAVIDRLLEALAGQL